jgi:hypothetical protein
MRRWKERKEKEEGKTLDSIVTELEQTTQYPLPSRLVLPGGHLCTDMPSPTSAVQARRSLPDAQTSDLFILLHRMLFTTI